MTDGSRSFDCLAAVVWPICSDEDAAYADAAIRDAFPVADEAVVSLSYRGIRTLMTEIYGREPWIGTVADHHAGVDNKARYCWREGGLTHVYLLRTDDADALTELKTAVRAHIGLSKHALHTTDSFDEAAQIAGLLLSGNSVDFLNRANPDDCLGFYDKLADFERTRPAFLSPEDFVIDGSAVLAVYGLRENQDIDVIVPDALAASLPADFEIHNGYCPLYGESAEALVYDPANFFRFRGYKFLAPRLLHRMKSLRGEPKDKTDVALLETILR